MKPSAKRAGPKSVRSAEPSIDTLTIRGKTLPTERRFLEQQRLMYFVENPRVYSIVRESGREPTQEEIETKLQDMEYVRELIQDIKQNDGLTDDLVVRDVTYEVIEGNSRLAAIRFLARSNPAKWGSVKCLVLPQDTDDQLISSLLGQWHLKGKKEWPPYEQAGYLYRRHHQQGIDVDELAKEVGLKTGKVRHAVDAYDFMVKQGENQRDRWSYYDEYTRPYKIRSARKKHPELDDKVVRDIRSGSIEKAMDLRDWLPVICQSEKTLNKYLQGKLKFEDAYEHACDAGADHTPYRRLNKLRTWLADEDVQTLLEETAGEIRNKIRFELLQLARLSQKLAGRL